MNSIMVLLPCYNEEENIDKLLDKWQAQQGRLASLGYKLSVVCVDDGSVDNTSYIIKGKMRQYPNIVLLAHEKNMGLGAALKTGILHFYENASSGDVAVVMDSDNTHDPKYIFSMLSQKRKQNADCVIASRYEPGAAVQGVPRHRVMLSDCAKYYYSLMLRVPHVQDYTCGYRLYSYGIIKNAVARYGNDLITQIGFACMMEILYKLHLVGAVFSEVPFELRYDNKLGKSKMKLLKTILYSLTTVLKLRIIYKQCELEAKKPR